MFWDYMSETENAAIDDALVSAVIANNSEIKIVSGEGEIGHKEAYTGAMTVRAIRSRLTRERCGGDRWARVLIDGRCI